MKVVRIALLSVIAIGLIFSYAFAAGNVEKGKSLFNDPKFAGGTKACNECHPDGRGLEKSGMKKEFNIGGKKQMGLEDAVINSLKIETTLRCISRRCIVKV